MYRLLICYRLFKRYILLKVKYTLFKLFDFRIGNYRDIDEGAQRIAFIDQDGMIHCEKEYEQFFHTDSLYNGGDYLDRKKFELSILLENNNNLLIEKKFSDRIFEFYNELSNLHRLQDLDFIPEVKYVSYSKNTIYTEFIYGCTLREKLARSGAGIRDIDMIDKPLTFDEKADRSIGLLGKVITKNYIDDIRNKYDKINSKKMITHDIKYGNILIDKGKIFLVDFETSIFFTELPAFLFNRLKMMDEEKIEKLFPVK
jgi:hypothetical protein